MNKKKRKKTKKKVHATGPDSSAPNNPRGYSIWHQVRLFLTYWVVLFMLVVAALFSIGNILPRNVVIFLYVATLVVAGIATFIHVRQGKKNELDDIAEHLK